jgi:hypothetical protein
MTTQVIRNVRKQNAKGFRAARIERLHEKIDRALYRAINNDFKESCSGRDSGRTKLLKKMMHVLTHTPGTSSY